MSVYAFTKVEQPAGSKTAIPSGSVSISKTGRIGLSREFISENGIDSDSRASLYWDADRKAIAIAFISAERKATPGAFTKVQSADDYNVVLIGSGAAAYVVANRFFKEVGVNPSEHQGFYKYETLAATEAGISDGGKTVFVVTLA